MTPCTSRWILAVHKDLVLTKVHKELVLTKVFKEICNGSGQIYYADLKETLTEQEFKRDWAWYTILATESYDG